MRATAALVVVLFHVQNELRHRGFADPFPDLTIGAFGVDLFFVVSGFIMVYASVPLFGAPGAPKTFLLRRIVRIVPLYWTFTAVFAAIALALGRLPGHPPASPAHILASFLFIPAARPEDGGIFPTYSLGWTLNYEMFFYLCFAVAIGLRRRYAVPAVAGGLVGLVGLSALLPLPWPLAYWGNSISLEFVFGMGIAAVTLAGRRLPPVFGAPLAAAALVPVAAFVPDIDSLSAWRGLAWGLPAAILVAAMLGAPVEGRSLLARAAVRLGDASYSLYLVHSALFIGVFATLSRVFDPRAIPPLAYAALLLAGSVLAALALFASFERPVTRRLQRLVGHGRVPARDRGGANPPDALLLPSSRHP